MIEVRRLSFDYGLGSGPVFENISLTIPDGAVTGVIGPNGSGKSTLLKLCARQLKPLRGTVSVSGRDAVDYSPKGFARETAYLPQERPVPAITVRSLTAHGRFPYSGMGHALTQGDEEAIASALKLTRTESLASRDMRSLSGGQRQRAYIAMLIAQRAKHLLLDEPMAHLDMRSQAELFDILETLSHDGLSIAVVMHDVALAQRLCDKLIVISAGEVVYDGDSDGLYESRAIEKAFGVRPVPGVAFERI